MQVTIPQATPTPATFARASTATYINEDGVLMYSAYGQPRYQNGVLLLEAAGSNLLQYSEDMRNTAEAGASRPWAQFDDTGDAVAVLSVSTAKPDGTTGSVSKLTANTTASVQRQTSQQISGLADNAVVTFSVCLKAGEVPRASLLISTKSPTYPTALFDLTTGVVSSTSGGGGAPPVAGIVALAGGWYRCWIAVSVGAGASTPGVIVQLKNAAGAHYSGAVGDGLFLWGAQAEIGSIPTSYIPRTGTAAASRAADSYSGGYMVSYAATTVGLPVKLVTEDPPTGPWTSGVPYGTGDLVHRASTHRVYKCILSVSGTTPPESDPTHWRDIRATQSWAPLVLTEDTQLPVIGNLYFTLEPEDAINSLHLSGIRAASARVVVTNGSTVAFDQSFAFGTDILALPPGRESALNVDLTGYYMAGSRIHVTLVGAGESALIVAGLRYLVAGLSYDLGGVLQGPRLGITDYSRKETDEFGTTTFVRRGYSKRVTLDLLIPTADMAETFEILAYLRATPALWQPSESAQLAPLTVYGWCKDFGITVAYADHSLCSIEIEGLI